MRHDEVRWRDPRHGPHRTPHHAEPATPMVHNGDRDRPWYRHWRQFPKQEREAELREERLRAHRSHKYHFGPVPEHPPHWGFTWGMSILVLAAFFPTAFVAASTSPQGQALELQSGTAAVAFAQAPLPPQASAVARDAAGDAAAFTASGASAYVVCHTAGSEHITLVVPAGAVSRHLAHGDEPGECAAAPSGASVGAGSGKGIGAQGSAGQVAGSGAAGQGAASAGAGQSAASQGAGSQGGAGQGASQEHKLEICHVPPGDPEHQRTVHIGASGWAAHEAHGDSLGACEGDEHDEGDHGRKVLICHAPPGRPEYNHTLNISVAAVDAHLAHGDSLGACGSGASDDKKITICHVPPGRPGSGQALDISASALAAHLAHGDTLGACPGQGSGLTLVIEDGQGGEIGDLSIRVGQSQYMVVVLYDNGTRVGVVNATWNTTGDLDPVAAGPSPNLTFIAQTVGTSGTVTASYNPTDATGTITIVARGGGGGGGGDGHGPTASDDPGDDGPPAPPGPGGDGGGAGGPGGFVGPEADDDEDGSSIYAPHDFTPEAAARGFHKSKNFDAEEGVGTPGHGHGHFDAHEFGAS